MAIPDESLYELAWSSTFLAVHRYGGHPSGEVLLVMTILMLDEAGEHVTMSELAEITQLPKSNVSRYVSDQVRIGHLKEVIDPRDRRRRVLHPTEEGRREQEVWKDRVKRLSRMREEGRAGNGGGPSLVEILKQMSRDIVQDSTT
jgi:DNA-binding MarR family transcriptional regulator